MLNIFFFLFLRIYFSGFFFCGFYKLDNLCANFDINRIGQSDPAPLQHDMDTYRKRLQSFGFKAVVVDGHGMVELSKAFHTAESTKNMPTAIRRKTFKGKDFPVIGQGNGQHQAAQDAGAD